MDPNDEVAPVETQEPLSMADTIAAKLREINSRNDDPGDEAPALASTTEAAPSPGLEKPARSRDATGKFAKDDKATESVTAAPDEAVQTAATKQKFAPKWQKAALEKWSSLDPTIQAEVEKREQDFHKGIEGYKTKAQAADEFEKALQPFAATIQSFGVKPHVAAQALFAADHALRFGNPQQKVAMLRKIALDYGIPMGDSNTTASGFGGNETQQIDPTIQQLYQRLSQLEGMQGQREVQEKAALEHKLTSDIAKFRESPGHEHFEILQDQMASLLMARTAADLDSAYQMAFETHPVTKSLWLAQQREAWAKEQKAKAETARKAAGVNVSPRGTHATAAPSGSMTDTIRSTAKALGLT